MPLHFLKNADTKTKICAAAAAAVVLVIGWRLYSNLTAAPEAFQEVPLVRTVTIGETATNSADVYPGEVRGRYESNLAFQVSGKIVSRQVNVGDAVRAGQVLMTIDPRDINQKVETDAAQLATAQANQRLAADNAARYRTLYQSGAVSKAMLEQYDTQLEASDAALRQAQAALNASTNQLEYTRLVSDADGVVASINGEIGQIAAAGSPIITVVQNGEREIQIYVPESKLHTVREGQQAQISFWALDNVTANGTITEIAPMADSVTKTYRVRVAVSDMPDSARLGMTAKVTLANGSADKIILPGSAIYQLDSKPQVWIVRDNHVQLANVEVSGYEGNNVVISKGLKDGDIVVTAGAQKLTANQEVRLFTGADAK